MDFQNVVCWDISRVRTIMNTNAESASRDIFLAVHSEYPLTASNPREGVSQATSNWTMDPQEFLRAFLSKDNSHMQVAVLGDSGSGKSHLIRWMELSIPEMANRYLISIPRSGISLRGVIELILQALPAHEAQLYHERLDQAGDEASSPEQLEERLLAEIALAIGGSQPYGHSDSDLDAELVSALPDIFNDPYLRKHFREASGVIRQLATQVLSASDEYRPVQERREFSVSDLPLTGLQTANMSAGARDICDFLRVDPEAQSIAVDIVNRNLNLAIGRVLHFTGDRLINLLGDVRRYLRTQGQELVLLVEDLARLQGLDLSLLEALIEEGNEDNGLCTLRWAAAVTTGYYSRVPDTVQTRMNFVIRMDVRVGEESSSFDEKSMVAFSAKYLNAARLDPVQLNSWATLPDEQRRQVPSACGDCPHRIPCHNTFGDIDGVGLYPFTENSVPNMLRRLDSRVDERFNPRILVKEVLAEVLGTYGGDLKNDRFPPIRLLNQMGGGKLPPIVADALQRHDPENAERQRAVLELWGNGSATLTDLPEELYLSFGLAKPPLHSEPHPRAVPEEQHPEIPESRDVDGRLTAIRAWGNGARMQDVLLNYIRPLLFNSIMSHIDWDNERLVQSHFSGASSGPFRRDSISFEGQLTQSARRPVTLKIPSTGDPGELSEAAIALEAIHLFQQHGNWNFPDGSRLLGDLANCLDKWSHHVVRQMKQLQDVGGKWDSAAAAVEILAVGAALGGRPNNRSATLPDWLNSLFEDWPQENSAQSREWRDLYQSVWKERLRLRELALARASGTKGGQRGAFIDPSKIVPPLRTVRRQWQLSHHPPNTLINRPDDIGALAKLHSRVNSELSKAAQAEWTLRTDWVAEWHGTVPEGMARREVVDLIRGLLNLAIENGVGFGSRSRLNIEAALLEVEGVQLDDALRGASILLEESKPVRRLPELGQNRGGNTRSVVRKFLPAVRDFLSELDAATANHIENLDQSGKDIQEHQANIRRALHQLSLALEVIGGDDADAD